MTYKGAPMMSVDQTWATPPSVVKWLSQYLNIKYDLDAAASNQTAKAPLWFTEKDDALSQEWFGNVWLNPPFGLGGKLQRQFIAKAIEECKQGRARSVTCLIPARTDTKLFHDLIVPNARKIYFVNGRINFEKQGLDNVGANATFPSMVVLFRRPRVYDPAKKRTRQRIGYQMRTLDMPQAIRRGKL